MGCFSGHLMSAASDQKLFCKLRSPFNCSFDEFVGEKVVSPSYSSAILTPPPLSEYLSLCGTAKLSSRMTVPFTHQQCMSDPISLYHCQNLVSSLFFILAIKKYVEWCFIVVLICISLMVNDVEICLHAYFPNT